MIPRNERAVAWCLANLKIDKQVEVSQSIFNALKKLEDTLWVLDDINLVFFSYEPKNSNINWKGTPIKKSYHIKRIINN